MEKEREKNLFRDDAFRRYKISSHLRCFPSNILLLAHGPIDWIESSSFLFIFDVFLWKKLDFIFPFLSSRRRQHRLFIERNVTISLFV